MPVWIDGGPRRSRRRRATRAAVFAAVPVLVIGGALIDNGTRMQTAADTAPGSAGGHGRGMSQLGALEYAKQGWSAQQILGHYYPGTTMGSVNTGSPVTVKLTKQSNLDVLAPAGAVVGGQQVAPGQAVSIQGATATVRTGCGGPVVTSFPAPDATVRPLSNNQSLPADQVLRFCGSNAGYRGSLTAKDGGVYNTVGLEDYVRSVVSVENSPDWADKGGTAALQAQAIAARSYALVRGAERGDGFDDTQGSQVYGGVNKEDPRTDRAVASTAGLVMSQNGRVYETEYGASRADDPQVGPARPIGQPGAVVAETVAAAAPAAPTGAVTAAASTPAAAGVPTVPGTATGAQAPTAAAQAPTAAQAPSAAGAVPTAAAQVPTAAAQPSVNTNNPTPTAPNSSQIAPSAGGTTQGQSQVQTQSQGQVPTVAQAQQAPADPKQTAATAGAAIAQAYQAAGGEGGQLGKVTGTPVLLPGGQAMFQSYEKGTVFWTPAGGAQVIPSGVAAPATLMNWAAAFASGGKPELPDIPMLNLIPGWGSLLGITPGGDTASLLGTSATSAPAAPSTAGSAAPSVPNSGAPTAPATATTAPAAPTTPATPAAPAAPSGAVATAAPR
ncbi:SpoIID/LytB domain-containing protein [Tsukamurella sp. 8F]|uniref:SpoIID/LytB domain-containing protein n=1 Tax=unclassified Tsukamurella TaxID=2633480 RepID=UPI0023B99534|nr:MULTISPECIES: SpoIID/LytB domain-containing protein [unclassified Tsukamurella]MDF0530801.1 SpoIID/LytB domain-containing protein [Tsukamurella sp. 8J]MDF0588327.1 SpoIID/LytB domain-containing protein [Tsukamurella sp. 8F]